jgi:uncharacterized protein YbjQ (UPF0145 family)
MVVTTTSELAGRRVVQHLGLVREITVRSRNVFGMIGASLRCLAARSPYIRGLPSGRAKRLTS